MNGDKKLSFFLVKILRQKLTDSLIRSFPDVESLRMQKQSSARFSRQSSYVEFRSVSTQTASPVCTGPYVTYTRNERMASGSSLIIREAILTCDEGFER